MAAEEFEFSFEREFDLPRVVVWDALVDPDLVGGWLAEASIEPKLGGRYDLVWLTSMGYPHTSGSICRFQEAEHLVVSTDNRGVIEFRLESVVGISRPRGTRLSLMVRLVVESVFATRVPADWMTSLDQLGELLGGHPVDWDNWDRDHAETWRSYLHAVRAGQQ